VTVAVDVTVLLPAALDADPEELLIDPTATPRTKSTAITSTPAVTRRQLSLIHTIKGTARSR